MEVEDINYHVMMHLDAEDLLLFCTVNKSATKSCANDNFWMDKTNYDKLLKPNVEVFTNGMKYYYTCNMITNYFKKYKKVNDKKYRQIKEYQDIVVLNDIHISTLILKYSDILYDIDDLSTITIKEQSNNYIITFKTSTTVDKFILNKQELVNFLFEGFIDDSLTIQK